MYKDFITLISPYLVDQGSKEANRQLATDVWTLLVKRMRETLKKQGRFVISGFGTFRISKKTIKRYFNFAPEGCKNVVGERLFVGFTLSEKFRQELKADCPSEVTFDMNNSTPIDGIGAQTTGEMPK